MFDATTDAIVNSLREDIESQILTGIGKPIQEATDRDWYVATTLVIRQWMTKAWLRVRSDNRRLRKKRVYYLSIEFLPGRLLKNALFNLDLLEPVRLALSGLGHSLDDVLNAEPDPALGNGGLGRLAACYLESMTSLDIPAYGYGIRYEHGLFAQVIDHGWQRELPEDWLKAGNPWELPRDREYPVGFGGSVEYVGGDSKTARAVWYPAETIMATTHDIPLVGQNGTHANILRLWGARAPDPIQLSAFNEGDHVGAMVARIKAEALTRILYPNDHTQQGQELRLRQEYFFTCASMRDIVRRHMEQIGDIRLLADYAAIQLNDTHPAVAIAELMRVLVDEHDIEWDEAWSITQAAFSFTNHTLLPEALEKWPVELFSRILPRHLQIIYLINWYHLRDAASGAPVSSEFIANVSLIEEGSTRCVRMGHLSYLGSHHVNGVSALHTDLLKATVFKDLAKAAPAQVVNRTNGISFRRWLFQNNPKLTALISECIGTDLSNAPMRLRDFEAYCDDAGIVERAAKVRQDAKARLATFIRSQTGVRVDSAAIFDVQVKRIHEYKRQTLNLLEAIGSYLQLRANRGSDLCPRVKIIAGKAAPGYARAKLLIKLANDIAQVINADPLVKDRLKLVFIPNYNVSLAELVIPATDLSEQISTAGMEASGTGNMKFAVNGALTIGTLDGANIEIREHVGTDNFFLFGLNAQEVQRMREEGFEGRDAVRDCAALQLALEALADGMFSPDDRSRYCSLVQSLLERDPFMVAADFADYWAAQRSVEDRWRNPASWWRASMLNTARMGWFNADRAVREYAKDIWSVPSN